MYCNHLFADTFTFTDTNGKQCHCHLDVYTDNEGAMLAIATDDPTSEGQNIINGIENLSTEILRVFKPTGAFRLIDHFLPEPNADPGSIYANHRYSDVILGRDIRWEHLKPETVHALISST